MPSFETLLVLGTALAAAFLALGLFALLKRPRGSAAAEELARGRFQAALATFDAADREGASTERDELYAAAVAARHLLELDRARELAARLVALDPRDGEAWLESGLAAAYAGDHAAADRALTRAAELRSDLAESITLHRAWLALRSGDPATARRRFEEVEASLESKLRSDLGAGDPLFAEWFLHAGLLWEALGEAEKAAWALAAAREAAPESLLIEQVSSRNR